MQRRAFLIVLAAAGFAAPAFSSPPVSDGQISAAVSRGLAADPVVKGGAIDVEVKNGVVTLRGEVAAPKQKVRADKIAKRVKGVKAVVNEIQIGHP